jgi:hypothetical protein
VPKNFLTSPKIFFYNFDGMDVPLRLKTSMLQKIFRGAQIWAGKSVA